MSVDQALDFLAFCEEQGGTMVAVPLGDESQPLELMLLRVFHAETETEGGIIVAVSDSQGNERFKCLVPVGALLQLLEEPLWPTEVES